MISRSDNAAPFRLHYDACGRLVLTETDGRQTVGVVPVRAFPISDRRRCLSICDAQGQELHWIASLDDLPGDVREILESDLAQREFTPVIERIVHVTSTTMPARWQVETDRGPTEFLVTSDDEVRSLGVERVLIVDSHGIRYLIPNRRRLDAHSRRVLDRIL